MAKKKSKKTFTTAQMSDLIDNLSEKTEIIIERDEDTTFINTGVYILNALISKSILKGGVANDRLTIFAGEPGTGKSYLMYNIARNAQKEGYYVFFIDTEHSVNKTVLSDFNIDSSPDKLKLVSSNNIENLKMLLTQFFKKKKKMKKDGYDTPKIIILLDSIGQLASEKEKNDALEGKNKQDMTRAKSIKQMFRIINADMGYLGIPMIASNHTYVDTNSFFPVQIMAGGKGAEYTASTIVFLSTAKLKSGREDELDLGSTGVTVTAQAKKNRFARPKKIKFEIDHAYGTNTYKGLEFFCTPENFEKVGIAKGKKVENEDGTIGINAGGTRWYVRHLDKSFYEKQIYNNQVFNEEVLKALDPIIIDYFSYASYEEEQKVLMSMEESLENEQNGDSDFDEIDEDKLF